MSLKFVFSFLSFLCLGIFSSCTNNLTEEDVLVGRNRAIYGVGNGSSVGSSYHSSHNSSFLPQPASASTVDSAKRLPRDKHGMPTYSSHSDRTRYVRTTAFSHMENEPGAHGRLTASGSILKYGSVRSAAADWSVYPLGTKFRVKGQPHIYVVEDYGSALAGTNTIDIYKPTLYSMRKWGTRHTEITVIQWGSYERSARMLKGRVRYDHCRHMYYGCMRKLNSRLVSSDIKKNGAL